NDAGELEQVTTDDIWNDDTFQAGIFNDENLDAAGIDFNGDGQLQADEVITPNGVTADLGRAEADFDDSIDTDEQSVVVVHPSTDDYDTVIDCGSITSAEETDDDMTVIYLQGTGESNLFGFATLYDDNSSMKTYIFTPNTVAIESSTPQAELEGAEGQPIAVHSGTCQDFSGDPTLELGNFEQTNAY